MGVLLYFFHKGDLPWIGAKPPAPGKEAKYRKIFEEKSSHTERMMKGFPELQKHMAYCRSLDFDTRPDYAYLRKLYQDGLRARGDDDDSMFDWVKVESFTTCLGEPTP